MRCVTIIIIMSRSYVCFCVRMVWGSLIILVPINVLYVNHINVWDTVYFTAHFRKSYVFYLSNAGGISTLL